MLRPLALRLCAGSRPGAAVCCRRWLNLQEYQSKKLMQNYGVEVQQFAVAGSVADAQAAVKELSVPEFVVKAQILAGGRGKGTFSNGFTGGVHLTKDPEQVAVLVESMLGHNLVTKQTGAKGVTVKKVMIAEALDISRETYIAILMDRDSGGPVLVGSPQGGVDIEEVAATSPEAIFKEPVDIFEGLTEAQADKMAGNLGFVGDKRRAAGEQLLRLYALFCGVDCTQVEINPFGETADGRVICFDAKLNFDDNAQFRQRDVFAMDDGAEADPREVEAGRHSLNYIGMDGSIGCLVNGAGLAMATMDIVQLCGGSPANFLDVGGGVTEEQVFQAFRILTSDPQVKCILVNIFGGIVNCATIAKGVTEAAKKIQLQVPLVVRLEGTNVQEAKRLLADSGLPIRSADNLEEAARKAVAALPS